MKKNTKYKVIYFTGAPASGKSTLLKNLKKVNDKIKIFEYGHELTKLLKQKNKNVRKQNDLRKKSSFVITVDDVNELDNQLIKLINKDRKNYTILIDSHAVTKEYFGYRVTAFSFEKISLLNPDMIIVLFSEAKITIERITNNSGGRPLINEFQANFHTFLQAAVAINYGIHLGIPIYFFDSNDSIINLTKKISKQLLKT